MSRECEENYDVYNETFRNAAKDHTCDACDRTIAKGERYARIFTLFDGYPEAIVRCVRCQTIHEHLRTLGQSDLWPHEHLNCGEEYEKHWGMKPPELIAALAFATPEEAMVIAGVIRFREAAHDHFRSVRFHRDYQSAALAEVQWKGDFP